MSNRIIDEQVVKMEFDNEKFEHNAQASLRTIDKLKEALKFENADKGFSKLENAANKVDFSHLERNIQAIANRFSTIGIIGDQVVRNLVDSVSGVIGKAGKLLAAPISQMIEGGKQRALNIAHAQFSLKGLGIDWKKESEEYKISLQHMTQEEQKTLESSGKFVDSLYKDIDYAVSGTAYGLDSAAKAASQLAASNVEIGDSMRMALRGISGVAAMSNREYDEIARIFTAAAGMGKVQASTLNEISIRGINAAAELGKQLGKSEGEIREMASKGKISFAMFAEAMDSAFGEHAKDANNTFVGAMSNVKAALSRIGADFAAPIYDGLILPLNNVRQIIDNIRVALSPLAKDFAEAVSITSRYVSEILKLTGFVTDQKLTIDQMPVLAGTIRTLEMSFMFLAMAIARVVRPFREAITEVFQPSGTIFLAIASAIARFTASLIINDRQQHALKSVLLAICKVINTIIKILGTVFDILGNISYMLLPMVDIIAELVGVITDTINVFIDWVYASGLIDTALEGISVAISFITGIIQMLLGYVAQAIGAFIDWASKINILIPPINKFGGSLSFIGNISKSVTDALDSFFGIFRSNEETIEETAETTEMMAGVLGERLAPELENTAKQAKKTKTVFDFVGGGISNTAKTITNAINVLMQGISHIGTFWTKQFAKVDFKKILDSATETITGLVNTIKGLYTSLLKAMGIKDGVIDWERIFQIGQAAAAFGMLVQLMSMLKDVTLTISTFSRAIYHYLISIAINNLTSAFKNIAYGVVAIAAALMIVSFIKPERLDQSVQVILAIIAAVSLFLAMVRILDRKLLASTNTVSLTANRIVVMLKDLMTSLTLSVSLFGLSAVLISVSGALIIIANAFKLWYEILSDTEKYKPEIVKKALETMFKIFLQLVLGATVLALAVYGTGPALFGLALAIGSIIVGVLAMAGIVMLLNNVDWAACENGLYSALAFLGMLTTAIAIMGASSTGTAIIGIGASLVGVAIALWAALDALTKLRGANLEELGPAVFEICVILANLVAGMILLSKFAGPTRFGPMLGMAFAIAAMAITLSTAVNSIEKLMRLDPDQQLMAFLEVISLIYMIGQSLRWIGLSGVKAGPVFGMSVLIVAICGAMSWIGLMKWETIFKGITSLASCILAIGFAFKLCGGTTILTDGVAILGVAAVIVAIAGSLALLTNYSWWKILFAVGELALATFVMTQIMQLAWGFNTSWTAMLGFAAAVAIMAGAIAILARIDDVGKVLIAAGAISAIMLAFGAAMQMATGFSANIPVIIALAGAAAALTVGLAVLIQWLSKLENADKALQGAKALALLMGGLTALMLAISVFGLVIKGAILGEILPLLAINGGVMVVLLGVIFGLYKVVELLAGIQNVEKAIAGAKALGILAGALAGMMVAFAIAAAIMTAASVTIGAAVATTAVVLIIIIALVALIIVALEEIGKWANAQGKSEEILAGIETGMKFMAKAFEGIGDAFGSMYGTAVKKFTEKIVEGIVEAVDNIKQIVESFNELKEIFKSWDEESIDATNFATSFKAIVDSLSGLAEMSFIMSGEAEKIVGNVTSKAVDSLVPGVSGFMSQMSDQFGNAADDMKGEPYARELETVKAMAKFLKAFNDELTGYTFDINAITQAQTAATAIGDFCVAMGQWFGLQQNSFGYGNPIDTESFKNAIVGFASALKSFNDEIADAEFNSAKIDEVITYLDRLVDLTNRMPQIFKATKSSAGGNNVGDKTSAFGDIIRDLGTAFSEFAKTINEVNTSKMEETLTTLERFADLYNRTATKASLTSALFTGIKVGDDPTGMGMGAFANQIISFGTALNSYQTKISSINLDTLERSIDTLIKLHDFLVNLKTQGNLTDNGFSAAIDKLADIDLSKFTDKFADDSALQNAINNLMARVTNADYSGYYDRMYVIGKKFTEKLRDGVRSEETTESLKTAMINQIATISSMSINDDETSSRLLQAGIRLIESIAKGISDVASQSSITTSTQSTISTGVSQALTALIMSLTQFGISVAKEIANGINSPTSISIISSAIKSAVSAAAQGIQVSISVGVDVDVSTNPKTSADFEREVLGSAGVMDEFGNVYKTKGAKLANTIKLTNTQTYNAIKTGSVSINSASQNAAKQEAQTVEQSGHTYSEAQYRASQTKKQAIEKDTQQTTDSIFGFWEDVANAIETGSLDPIEAAQNAFTNITNAIDGWAKGTYKELTGIDLDDAGDQMAGEIDEVKDKVTGAIDDMTNKVGGAGGGGGGGGGGAAGGFVASYSEFWQNLYLVNHQGINAFEQQFETFEQWQENTLKKTQEIIDNYKNAVVDAKKKAAEGLFSEVPEPKEDVTKEKLKKNLQDQVNQIKEFNNIILQLRTRLMGTNLFDAITEMGVDSIDELRALNSMTNEELSEYASLYDQKYVASFQTIQQKAQSELQNLYGGMQINIDQFAATFDGSLKSVEGYFAGQAEAIKAAGASVGTNLTAGVAEGVTSPEAKEALQTGLQGMADAIHAGEGDGIADAVCGISSPAELTKEIGKYLVMGVAEGMKDPEAQQSLVDAMTQVMQAFLDAVGGANSDSGIGVQMQTLGTSITQSITEALTNIEIAGQNFYNSGADLMTKFVEGFKSQQSIAQANINITLTSIADNIKGIANITKFKTAGTELFKGLMKGFETGWTGAGEKGGGNGEKSYGKTVIEKVMKGIFKILKEYKGGGDSKSKSNTFYKIGQEFIKGLIKGLESKQGELYAAVERIVKEAIARAKAAAAVASPSKKTAEIGMYMGMGLVNGLMSMSGAVSEASSSITEEALQGFRDISQVLGGLEDFDATPVIAPVMDLSNIQNGVSEMGSLLDKNSSYEMAASIQGGLDAQRTAKLNEMTNLRRAMDSVYNSNTARTTEMANLQAAVANLNSSINNQTSPDYTQLQMAINGLNNSFNAANTGTTVNMNPVFNIQSNDPETVAEEVNAALQHMIDRRSAVWA